MIVEPDFLNHWKTRTFVAAVMDYCETQWKPNANPNETQWQTQPFPMDGPVGILLRFWAHCHQRKTSHFNRLTPLMLSAICEWRGSADWLMETLQEVGFLDIDGAEVVAHDWDETNATMIRNWKNGKLGGRPKKGTETQTKPSGEPKDNRIEGNRIEGSTPPTPSGWVDSSSLDSGGSGDGHTERAENSSPLMGNDDAEKNNILRAALPSAAAMKRATRSEMKRRTVEPVLPMMQDLGGLPPGRSAKRAWTWEEYGALLELCPLDPEDVAVVAEYYRARLSKEKDFRRRDLITLLNNWHGDVGKCRQRLKELVSDGAQGPRVHVL